MPFPKIKNLPRYCSCGNTQLVSREFDDNGLGVYASKPIHEILPPTELYDLGNLLKNKIPLEEVNPRILGKNNIVITAPSNVTTAPSNNDSKPTQKKEINDEE